MVLQRNSLKYLGNNLSKMNYLFFKIVMLLKERYIVLLIKDRIKIYIFLILFAPFLLLQCRNDEHKVKKEKWLPIFFFMKLIKSQTTKKTVFLLNENI